MFMVAWQRVVLLGPHRIDRLPGLGWSPRETAYLVHLIKVAGMTFVLMAAFMLTVGPIDPRALRRRRRRSIPTWSGARRWPAPLAVGFIVSMLLALRVSYGLAATAVDVPFSPRLSWAYSRGNGWTDHRHPVPRLFRRRHRHRRGGAADPRLMRGVLGAEEAAAVVSWTVAILVVLRRARASPRRCRRSSSAACSAGAKAPAAAGRSAGLIEGRAAGRPAAGRPAAWGSGQSSTGATHFSAWPSRGCGVPFHLRQAKTGISRWNVS